MAEEIPQNVQTLAEQLMEQEGGLERVCGEDAPEDPHPDGGTYKSQCNACLQKDENKDICVATLITQYMAQNN